jgi:hypothetical protein
LLVNPVGLVFQAVDLDRVSNQPLFCSSASSASRT